MARVIVLIAIALSIGAYLPGLSGGFVFDDYGNILQNRDLQVRDQSFANLLQAGWSGQAGPLKRPIPMMSFALNNMTTGSFVVAYKITNLVIHLANGVLLFVFFTLLLKAHRVGSRGHDGAAVATVAAIATAIWLVHPINLTSVLYIVQRMNSLSGMFSLSALVCYCYGRHRLLLSGSYAWCFILFATPIFIVFALLSKENAVLTVPLIVLVEVCLFRFRTTSSRDRTLLYYLFITVTVVPILALIAFLATHPSYLADLYAQRPFTLMERVLTETRVLWFYLGLLFVPRLQRFGLHHDDYELSRALLEPMSTNIAVAGLFIALMIFVFSIRRYPMVAFGIGWYLLAHSLESSVFPLELVHEHRNYLPVAGVIFAVTYGISRILSRHHVPAAFRVSLPVCILSILIGVTALRAGDWSDPVTHAYIEAERHPKSFRAVYDLARMQFGQFQLTNNNEDYDKAIATLKAAAKLDKSATLPIAALIKLEFAHGDGPDPYWITELERRYRHELFHVSKTSDLHQMVVCRAKNTCKIPLSAVIDFFYAAMANPTVADYSRAQIMVDLAALYINEDNDTRPAMNLVDDAVKLFPDEFRFRNVRAQVYLRAGRFDEVESEIRHMRSVSIWRDKVVPPVDEIEQLEETLMGMRREALKDA